MFDIDAPAKKVPGCRPHLSLQVNHRLGSLELAIAFQLTQPWTVLFGPSGSGKSTVLRAIAGLFRLDRGTIVLHTPNGTQVVTDTERRIFVPPHRRLVRWSAQRAALFPHMTVRENLRFVAEANGKELIGKDIATTVDHALTLFHLSQVAEVRSATLSGGEQHRVALARAAIASAGCLLLLDEPFSGLDTTLRDDLLKAMRVWITERQTAEHRTPVLSVTHDIGEAFLLGAEVIRLNQGRVIAQGPVAEVLAEERSRLLTQLA